MIHAVFSRVVTWIAGKAASTESSGQWYRHLLYRGGRGGGGVNYIHLLVQAVDFRSSLLSSDI